MGRAILRGRAALAAALVLVAAVAVLAGLARPASAGAVTYGLGDSEGAFAYCLDPVAPCCSSGTCPAGSIAGYWDADAFRALTAPTSAHPLTEVRTFVAYDAVAEWNGSTTAPGCVPSRVSTGAWIDGAGRMHPAAQSWRNLVAELAAARTDGLTPLVAIAGYGSPNAKPAWDAPAPDPTTLGGYWEYRCGVTGLMGALAGLPADEQPHLWEAFNEPDGFAAYNGDGPVDEPCAVGQTTMNGAAKAACDYVIAGALILTAAGHEGDTLVAGTLSHPSIPYLEAYAHGLAAQLPGRPLPPVWSVHDYGDVTASYDQPSVGPLRAFDQTLGAVTGGGAHELWVTEAGTLLTDPAAGPAGGCGEPAGAPATLGACVNGQPAREAAAAEAFFGLAGAGVSVPITHLFWYQWQGQTMWDSGLVDGLNLPRTPWCVWVGGGACPGSAAAVGSG